jgi:hypothetical protein
MVSILFVAETEKSSNPQGLRGVRARIRTRSAVRDPGRVYVSLRVAMVVGAIDLNRLGVR